MWVTPTEFAEICSDPIDVAPFQPASAGVADARGGWSPARRMCSMWVTPTEFAEICSDPIDVAPF